MSVREGDWMALAGALDMNTVPALYDAGLQRLASEDLRVDFSQVVSVDSAAVSMLLGWARAAHRSRHTLQLAGLPEDLLSLARLYGVDELLPKQLA